MICKRSGYSLILRGLLVIAMITTDINTIQSTIDYICSQPGYLSLDKDDFEQTCAHPVMMIEKKGQNVEDIIKGVSDILADNTLTIPAKTLVHIESNILTMSDLQLIQEALKDLNAIKFGMAFNEPEGALIKVVIIG